jgi:beta-glucosidase
MNASDAFVVAWLPGSEGEGVADVILGKNNGKPRFDFKGRLSFSWPMTAAPMELNIGQKDYSPLFSFGYGLTYRDIDKLGDNLSEVPFPSADDENAPQNRIQIYSGQTLAPFASYVGDKDNWKVELPSGRGATSSGSVKVKAIDRNTQEDSRQITFIGETPSNFFVESATPVNMTEFSENRGVLKIDLRVDKSAESPVYLLMGCQDGGCPQKIDISKSLASFSLGEWTSLTVDLKCFHDLGTNFSQIFTPLSLFTSGPLTLSISKIEIQKATSEREHIKCP